MVTVPTIAAGWSGVKSWCGRVYSKPYISRRIGREQENTPKGVCSVLFPFSSALPHGTKLRFVLFCSLVPFIGLWISLALRLPDQHGTGLGIIDHNPAVLVGLDNLGHQKF